MRRQLTTIVLLASAATPLFAQSRDAQRWLDDCRSGRWGGDREQFCDVREQTIAARSRLRVDGRENGGIEVIGEDRNDIRVISKIQAQAGSENDAKELASDRELGEVGPGIVELVHEPHELRRSVEPRAAKEQE